MIHYQSTDPQEGTLRDLAPDFTPLLDILFILIVFFLLTAGASYKVMDLDLPQSVKQTDKELTTSAPLIFEIHQDHYVIDDISFTSLPTAIDHSKSMLASSPERELAIAGDKKTSLEKLLNVLNTLQSSGINSANILLKPQQGS